MNTISLNPSQHNQVAKNISFSSKNQAFKKALSLNEFKPNQVVKIEGFSNKKIRLKLLKLGILLKDTVEIYAKAPFGGPIAIKKKGTTIALDKATAMQIQATESAQQAQKISLFKALKSLF